MYGFRILGLFALIPTALLLTVSFFVLFAIRKIESQGLKAFGYVISAILWICAVFVFSVGIYVMSTGRHPMMPMMQEMMKGGMQQQMMQRNMMQKPMTNR